MIPEEVVQEVLARADIVQIVSEYVTLKRAGTRMKGLCPFHGEKTPSFHVTPSKNLFYCFGCGEGGTAVDFLKKIEGMSFPEVIDHLGGRYGIEVPRVNEDRDEHRAKRAHKEALQRLMLMAESFFQEALTRGVKEAIEARAYLERRKINAEMRKLFRLGYAPPEWDQLTKHLRKHKISDRLAQDSGLVVPKDRGGHYDRFRQRLIFPVIDVTGQSIAFGGRALNPDDNAKYINSPETPLYTKGKALYGIHAAREHIRKSKRLILVEGNVDVVRMHQEGFGNTVAPMGTALTESQLKLAGRYAESITILFDGDNAGRKAARKALGPLLAAEIPAKVALLPDGEDPDSFLNTYRPEDLQDLLKDAAPLAQWSLTQECQKLNRLPVEARRGAAFQDLHELLSAFPSRQARRHYLEEGARQLGLEPEALRKALGEVRGPRRNATQPQRAQGLSPQAPPIAVSHMERTLTGLLLQDAARLLTFIEAQGLKLLDSEVLRALLQRLYDRVKAQAPLRDAINQIENQAWRSFVLDTLFSSEQSPEQGEEAFTAAQASLTERWIEREITQVAAEMERALSRDDISEQGELNARYIALLSYRQELTKTRKINWDALHSSS